MSQSVYELDSLIDWLEKQPADGKYNYADNRNCLCAQYLRAKGLPVHMVCSKYWYERDETSHVLPFDFNAIARDDFWSYGEALRRARNIKAFRERFF